MNSRLKKPFLLILAAVAVSVILSVLPVAKVQAEGEDYSSVHILFSPLPRTQTIKTGDSVLINVYFYASQGLDKIVINNKNELTETSQPPIIKDGPNLWHYEFELSQNSEFPVFAAYNTVVPLPTATHYWNEANAFSDDPDYAHAAPMLSQKDLIFLDEEGNEYAHGQAVPGNAYVLLNYEPKDGETVELAHISGKYDDRTTVEPTLIAGRKCYPVEPGYYEFFINFGGSNGGVMFLFDGFSVPEYEWNGEEVTATSVSSFDPSNVVTETVPVNEVTTTPATCTTDGQTSLVADFSNPIFSQQTKPGKVIQALGHSWNDPLYQWDTTYASCTATRYCSRDGSHLETEKVTASSVVTSEATCTEKGKVTYTASFSNEAFETQTVTADTIPAKGHNWKTPTYDWNDTNTTVTASTVCLADATHTITETAGVTKTVLVEPTCTEEGESVYTANFRNTAFSSQTKFVMISALGHMYQEATYTWSSDNNTVTATRVCVRDENHTETEVAEVTRTVTKQPTAYEDGEMTLTAVFKNGAFVTQTKTEAIPKLGYGTYRLVSGANETYTLGTNTSLQFIFSRSTEDETTIYHFQGIKIDDLTVDSIYYVVRSGSVILDISGVYLETLSTGAHTLYAMFDDGDDVVVNFTVNSASGTVVTYKVIFNPNGHGDWPDTQTVESGKTVTRPTDPKADGYVFGGWYIDSACTVAFNFNNPITQNTTLYAKWTMSGASDGGGGSGGGGTGPGNTDNPATGDNSNPAMWAALMLVSLAGAATVILAVRKEKQHS